MTTEVARSALAKREVDQLGLDRQDRRYLTTLISVFGGGPASMESGEYQYTLDRTLPGAHTLDLLFALHRNRSVQFVVAPPRS